MLIMRVAHCHCYLCLCSARLNPCHKILTAPTKKAAPKWSDLAKVFWIRANEKLGPGRLMSYLWLWNRWKGFEFGPTVGP